MITTSEKLLELQALSEQNLEKMKTITDHLEMENAIVEGEKIMYQMCIERITLLQQSIKIYPTRGLKKDLKLFQAMKKKLELQGVKNDN